MTQHHRAFLGLAVCLAVVGICNLAAFWWLKGKLEAGLATRPPLVVLDYTPVATALAEGAPPQEIQPHFAELKRRAAVFRRAGYLVLNAAAVDSAPDHARVPTPATPVTWTPSPGAEPEAMSRAEPPSSPPHGTTELQHIVRPTTSRAASDE